MLDSEPPTHRLDRLVNLETAVDLRREFLDLALLLPGSPPAPTPAAPVAAAAAATSSWAASPNPPVSSSASSATIRSASGICSSVTSLRTRLTPVEG